MTPPLLEATGLRVERGGRVLFSGISLAVEPGEKVAVTGPSGTGKTSLLSVLAGLATPEAGTVTRAGVRVTPGRLPGATAAVLQGFGLVSLLTAAENVEIGLRAAGLAPRAAMQAAQEALTDLGLGEHAGHLVQELSGGQQQRVAVARALASRPGLLIADEPTAEQDAVTRELVLARMFAVAANSAVNSAASSAVNSAANSAANSVATHDPEVAARCDRVLNLARHLPTHG